MGEIGGTTTIRNMIMNIITAGFNIFNNTTHGKLERKWRVR